MLRLVGAILLGVAVVTAEDCPTLKTYVESACSYPSLVLTSSPDNLVVDKDTCNNEYNKTAWQQQPKVTFDGAKADKSYTIVAIDPDAPTHEGGQYFLHWIVSNVPGQDLTKGDVSRGTEIEKYRGPGPPKGTGKHRYIFLLFEQTQKEQSVSGVEKRYKFELLPWLRGQKIGLCGPIAGSQFQAQF